MPERHFDWLSHFAATTPDNPCWTDLASNRAFTFAAAENRCRRLARHLTRNCGVRHGDRVAVLAMNSSDVVEIHSACSMIGAIFLPLNWRLAAPELDFIMSDCEPAVLIHDTAMKDLADALTVTAPHRIETSGLGAASEYEAAIAESDGDHALAEVSHDDIWTIFYTSGTTGRPKGAPNTFKMAFYNAVNLSFMFDIGRKSVGLTILPLFHTAGVNCYTAPLLHAGAHTLIMRAFDPGETLKVIGDPDHRLTHFFGVPANYLFMSQHPDFASTDLSRLARAGVGGAPTPVPLLNLYGERGIVITQGFGMSETSPLVCGQDFKSAREKPGSAGRSCLHGELKVARDDGSDADRDEIGELWVRGPNITPGYWRRPEANKTDWSEDGWFKTGDAARLDPDGDVWIVDRWKDMYISGGENVYPAEVENTLFALPGVADGAIIGAADEKWGEVGVAFVVKEDGAELDEAGVIDWFDGKVARFKIPKRVEFTDELPRNATGKVLKRVLRERLDG